MKMGYYANAQIESMMLGVPTVTFVRPEFMTTDLEESGFIICELAELEEVLEHYLRHPEELSYKRARARPSIEELHNNGELARRLIGIYQQLAAGGQGQAGESDCTQPIANHGRHT
jgi:glycosyltransferase involved in cell wall biosynthesis